MQRWSSLSKALLEAWSRNRSKSKSSVCSLTQDCAHLSVWKGWTVVDWKCTFGLSTRGRTVLWDGHQSTVCASRDQGLGKHWLQPAAAPLGTHISSPQHKINIALHRTPEQRGLWSQRFHSLRTDRCLEANRMKKSTHPWRQRCMCRALVSARLEILWDHSEITFLKISATLCCHPHNSTGSCGLCWVTNTGLMDNGKPSTIYDHYRSLGVLCADLLWQPLPASRS